MKGSEALALALLRSADRCYTVSGYPISDLAASAGAAITVNKRLRSSMPSATLSPGGGPL